MSFKQFQRIAAHLGIPKESCTYDKEKGLFSFKAGELRVTSNHYSNKISVLNVRTGARFMSEVRA